MKDGLISTLVWTPKPPKQKRSPLEFAAPPATDPTTWMIDKIGLPEVPGADTMTAVQEAIYLLKAAAEIEHGLLVQYLYAAYSLDINAAPVVRTWQRTLIDIAIQEMDHLLNVQNLLMALEAETYFDRANFPVGRDQMPFYPFRFRLEPVTATSLATYVLAESPAMAIGGNALDGLTDQQKGWYNDASSLARAAEGAGGINQVGLIYARLYWMFQQNDTPAGPWLLAADRFQGVRHIAAESFPIGQKFTALQGDPDTFQGDPTTSRIIWPIGSFQDALSAIAQIAEQGEGTKPGDLVPGPGGSHYIRFLNLFGEFTGFTPPAGTSVTLPVPVSANTTGPAASTDPDLKPEVVNGRIEHPVSALWAKLFNLRYLILLQELALALAETSDQNPGSAQRDSLVNHAIGREMAGPNGLRGFAGKLVKLPLKATGDAHAAPPFELPDEKMPTDTLGRQKYLLDRIDDSAATIEALLNVSTTDPHAPSSSDRTQLNQLKTSDKNFRAAVAALKFP